MKSGISYIYYDDYNKRIAVSKNPNQENHLAMAWDDAEAKRKVNEWKVRLEVVTDPLLLMQALKKLEDDIANLEDKLYRQSHSDHFDY